jgi:ATP-dependent Lon protease
MKEEKTKSEVLEKLKEVLDELKIDYQQVEAGYILLKNEDIILDEPDNLCKYLNELGKKVLLGIYPNGEIRDLYDNFWFFKLCNKCGKFFLGPSEKKAPDECIYCKSSSVKYLSKKNKIPNWNVPEKECLLKLDFSMPNLDSINERKSDAIRKILQRLSKEAKNIIITDEIKAKVQDLGRKYPNMAAVQQYLLEQIELSKMKKSGAFNIKPILLLGNAGCGKTSYIVELAIILLGFSAVRIDLGNDISSFSCVGSDPSYVDAKQGKIIDALCAEGEKNPIKNPIIHFDELDKVRADAKYTVETIFYSILEKRTAKRFVDNFIGVEVDASEINYIFTANTIEGIPEPILNRLRIFQIPDYTEEQLREVVIDNFYQNWLNSNGLRKECFPEVLSDEIKNKVMKISNGDTRSINDALTKLFAETMRVDDESGERIALFSEDELCGGWQHFRGKSDTAREKWVLPKGFKKPVANDCLEYK